MVEWSRHGSAVLTLLVLGVLAYFMRDPARGPPVNRREEG